MALLKKIHGRAQLVFDSPFLPAAIILGGVVFRIALLMLAGEPRWATAEAANVAISFALTGVIGDAYVSQQGPTAHLNPVMPVLAGTVYWLFGVRSPLSEMILAAFAICIVMASFALLYLACKRMGISRRARLMALTACCFLPIYQGMEVGDFRIWEGGLAVFLSALFLYSVLKFEQRDSVPGWREVAALSLLSAITFFISPPTGLAAYCVLVTSFAAHLARSKWPIAALVAAVTLAAVIAPWTVRNSIVMGEPVILRSNLGLELSLAYFPEALDAAHQDQALFDRFDAVHPLAKPHLVEQMKKMGGEIAYSRALGQQTAVWIRKHPLEAVQLTIRHFVQFWFPPQWVMKLNFRPSSMMTVRETLLWSTGALSLIAAAISVFRADRRRIYLVIFLSVPACFYAITQPTTRYRYLVFSVSLFLAADLIDCLSRAWKAREVKDISSV
jgi:Ca2+/Na+ antiporter